MAVEKSSTAGRARDVMPVRGTPGGWRDWWDDPATSTSTLRAMAAALQRQQAEAAAAARQAIRVDDEA